MVDTQYVPTRVYFKSQDLVHILENLIITLFTELRLYTSPSFY
jgi:hypothetical protein